jgi:GNAT superfamily N-acetyltransferase
VSEVLFSVVDATGPEALWAMTQYFHELEGRFEDGFDTGAALAEAVTAFNPPSGIFVIAEHAEEIVGGGAIQFLDAQRAEIRRMWVSSHRRGVGLGKRLLAHLESEIARSGRTTVMLDTNSTLTEAIAMYRACGYIRVDKYNDNPYAHLWFSKTITAITMDA